MSKTERQQYKIAGPATWELIRAAYLGGDSARSLAERFGVSEHAIRKRITVEGWTKRYDAARTDDIPAMDQVAAWLAANLPTSGPATLIHNDFKYDNLVLDPDDLTRVRGVLDWEMATIGDPLMDLGTALCYWVEAGDAPELRAFAFGPTAVPGSYTRREFAEHYARVSGRSLAHLDFYSAFGLYKTAVVAQQIYLRFVRGHTSDPRFAMMIAGVRALATQAAHTLEQA